MRALETIVIHCSDTPETMDIGVAEIRRWHLERGWRDIGYHFVIRRDGRVETGRAVARIGAHVRGRNARSIGVCLVGGSVFTPAQWRALYDLTLGLRAEHGIAAAPVGHRDLDGRKSCPNFAVSDWWADVTAARVALA